MNLTLHLTDACNMDCAYCTQEKSPAVMSGEVLDAAVRLAFSEGMHAGFSFFGGEPLLCPDSIFRVTETAAALSAKTGKPVYYRMTTNGTLLSDKILALAARVHMQIGLSFDGRMQDACRRFRDGRSSFADTEKAAKRLLAAMPETVAMMTAAPEAAEQLAGSVMYLYALGFRYIHAVPAYGKKVTWTAAARELLSAQMRQAAAFYCECLLHGEPFFFGPVETKIRDLLSRTSPGERCHLGRSQLSVAPDGRLYACTQFIGDAAYCVGDVFSGVSREKCAALALRHTLPEDCRGCPLRPRCLNSCGCLNRLETGSAAQVSPMQCSYEKMLIALADETAAYLRAQDPARFAAYFMREGKTPD